MAEMWKVIIKNNEATDYFVEDLGIGVLASGSVNFHEQFTYDEIAGSDDVRIAVVGSDLVVNDGFQDLDAADGSAYLTLENLHHLESNYYDKITVDTISGSLQTQIDTYSYHGNLSGLGDDDHTQYSLADGSRDFTGIVSYDSAKTFTSDAQIIDKKYVDDQITTISGQLDEHNELQGLQGGTIDEYYHLTSAQHTDLTDGGDATSHKHDDRYYTETELDAGQLDNRYYTETELQTSGQSSVHWDNITNTPDLAPNTLDDAYDEGGQGAGRTIVVDSGPVKLDATVSGSYAPLELTELSVLPTTGLAAGQLGVKDGILYVYDGTRSKWLSAQRMFLTFGKKGKTKDQFLAFGAGELYSNNSGYRLSRNATIVSITGQLDASGTCDIRIRRNDSATNIATLSISAAIGDSDTTLNTDLNANDYLQSHLESAAGVEDPVTVIEVAWRG